MYSLSLHGRVICNDTTRQTTCYLTSVLLRRLRGWSVGGGWSSITRPLPVHTRQILLAPPGAGPTRHVVLPPGSPHQLTHPVEGIVADVLQVALFVVYSLAFVTVHWNRKHFKNDIHAHVGTETIDDCCTVCFMGTFQ